VDILCH
ncbi:cytochrome c family protein, partial [Vibrio parahaemolyticus V-223/04]